MDDHIPIIAAILLFASGIIVVIGTAVFLRFWLREFAAHLSNKNKTK